MRLAVRVTPRAAANEVSRFDEVAGILHVRVTAPPADGAANEAVTKLLAKTLGLAQREVVLVSGATGRNKMFEIPLDGEDLKERVLREAR